MAPRHPLDVLNDDEIASLTGFTTPMVKMLAHARDAWIAADRDNGMAIEHGLYAMLQGHSFVKNRRLVVKVLTAGLDPAQRAQLLMAIGVDEVVR